VTEGFDEGSGELTSILFERFQTVEAIRTEVRVVRGRITPELWLVEEARQGFPKGYVGQLLRAVGELFSEVEAEYRKAGRSLEEEYRPDELAQAMIEAAIPLPSPWDRTVGAHFSRRGVMRRLRISESVVEQLVGDRALLELKTREGVPIYPQMQFVGAEVLSGLSQLLSHFPADAVGAWTLAAWLATPSEELAQRSPIEILRDAGLTTELRAAATEAAKRFGQ